MKYYAETIEFEIHSLDVWYRKNIIVGTGQGQTSTKSKNILQHAAKIINRLTTTDVLD